VDGRDKPGHDEPGEGIASQIAGHFPCHFGPLGLKARHVRSPRTPGGLLRDAKRGRDAAFNFLQNKDLD
jgi:hypothetical protein